MNIKKIKIKALRVFRNITSLFSEMNTDSIKIWYEKAKTYTHGVVMDFNIMYNNYRENNELKMLGIWMLVLFIPVTFFSWSVNILLIILFALFRGHYLRNR